MTDRIDAKESARAMFERKVELLESWAKNGGAPAGSIVPAGVVALRRWSDPALGLSAWVSPNVVAPNGRHGDLRRRYDDAMTALGRQVNSTPEGKRAATVVFRQLKLEVVRLAEQVVLGQDKISSLESALQRERQLRAAADKKVAELTAELATVTPFRSLRP